MPTFTDAFVCPYQVELWGYKGKRGPYEAQSLDGKKIVIQFSDLRSVMDQKRLHL